MAPFAEFSRIRAVLARTADRTAEVVEQFYGEGSSESQGLDEALAWVAAIQVEEITEEVSWESDPEAAFFLTLAVHEVLEWVARTKQLELRGAFIAHDSLSWCPSAGYEFGSQEYGRIVAERWTLLLDELGVPKQKEVA
jgi:hypothetical protein